MVKAVPTVSSDDIEYYLPSGNFSNLDIMYLYRLANESDIEPNSGSCEGGKETGINESAGKSERFRNVLVRPAVYRTYGPLRLNCSAVLQDENTCCMFDKLMDTAYPFVLRDDGTRLEATSDTVHAVETSLKVLARELQAADEELFMYLIKKDVLVAQNLAGGEDLIRFVSLHWEGSKQVTKVSPESSIHALWALNFEMRTGLATSITASRLLSQLWYMRNGTKQPDLLAPTLLCEILKPACRIGENRQVNAFSLYM